MELDLKLIVVILLCGATFYVQLLRETPTHVFTQLSTEYQSQHLLEIPNPTLTNQSMVIQKEGSSSHCPKCDRPQTRIAYITRHGGTGQDWRFIAYQLNLEFHKIDPNVTPLGLTAKTADEYWVYLREICKVYDAIIIADTIPDGRPLIRHHRECPAQIVLQITNRFDFAVKDKADYHKEVNDAASSSRVHIVAETLYEPYHLRKRNITNAKPIWIPSTGYRDVTDVHPGDIDPTNKQYFCYIDRNYFDFEFPDDIPVKKLRHAKYGGGKGLAEYKALIEFPYQVSTMAFYENLMHGVVIFLPTAQFFKDYWKPRGRELFEDVWEVSDWTKYIDWYSEQYKHLFIHYHSWDHLVELMRSEDIDYEAHSAKVKKHMKKVRQQAIDSWRDLIENKMKLKLPTTKPTLTPPPPVDLE